MKVRPDGEEAMICTWSPVEASVTAGKRGREETPVKPSPAGAPFTKKLMRLAARSTSTRTTSPSLYPGHTLVQVPLYPLRPSSSSDHDVVVMPTYLSRSCSRSANPIAMR